MELRESGKPEFDFALFLGPPEAVGMGIRNAISKGGGEGWKT